MNKNSGRVYGLVLGDILSLYLALFLALLARYGADFYYQFANYHAAPFTIIFGVWVLVFYISGLYDLRHLRNNIAFLKTLGTALAMNSVVAALFFYLIPYFGITPKTNLFIFLAIFAAVEIFWRRLFNNVISSGEAPNKILLVGDDKSFDVINRFIKSAPEWLAQLGYSVAGHIGEKDMASDNLAISRAVKSSGANLVVVPRNLRNNDPLTRELYKLLNQGIEIYDLPKFYEIITRKVPLETLEETWFLENISQPSQAYEFGKRTVDILVALAAIAATTPIWIVAAVVVWATSRGPIIFKQQRVGKGRKIFTLYKFRTMKMDSGHFWPEENDSRITAFGKILRKTHLDELPQAINVLRGDISIVGPRPDFVDFFDKLAGEIPYYEIRTIIRPGVTGWAQVHQPITASLEETKERLCYDLYYIKNKSLALDLAIIMKTIKILFTAKGR